MDLRGQSQPEEEETGKEWKALEPIHFDMLPAWACRRPGDEDHSMLALKLPPIHRKRLVAST